jgi:hypothetical protein
MGDYTILTQIARLQISTSDNRETSNLHYIKTIAYTLELHLVILGPVNVDLPHDRS